MSGIPGMSFIGALISMFMFIEQQLIACEQHPPPQANAASVQHKRPQQPRTDIATNFMIESPR
jgi:hypothetical protein